MSDSNVTATVRASGGAAPPKLVGEPIELARRLVPMLAECDQEIDVTGRIPGEVMDALKTTGLPWMMMPRRSGGAGQSMRASIEVSAELARGSGSVGWMYALLSGVTAVAGSLPEEAVRRIFRTGEELVCGVTAPTGTARRVEGGYIVNGKWGYASGSQFADWALGGVRVIRGADDDEGSACALMPIGDGGVTILNTWHVSGMRGSSSDTLVADDVFVPSELVTRAVSPGPTLSPSAEPRDNWPGAVVLPLAVIGPTLGATRNILERTVGSVNRKGIPVWGYEHQSDSHVVLEQLGLAATEIDSAWLHIQNAIEGLDITAQHRFLTQREQVRLHADCGYAVQLLRRAADRLLDINGASAFAVANPVQRAWRDVAIASRHTFVNSLQAFELYGRSLAGARLQMTLHRNNPD